MTTLSNLAARGDAPTAESYGLLRLLIDRSRDVIAAIDKQYRLLVFNQAFADEFVRLYGKEPRLGDDLLALLAHLPEERALTEQVWRRALAGEEFRVVAELGDARRTRATYELSFGALSADGYAGAFHIARDISDRVRAEQEVRRLNAELEARVRERTEALERANQHLREREVRLSAALEASQTGTFRRDLNTGLSYWDANLQRLFGLDPDDIPRTDAELLELVHPEDRPAVSATLARGSAQEGGFQGVFRMVCGDGRVRWMHYKSKLQCAADGTPLYVAGACSDVTALKEAERELERREARVRALADSMPVIVWALDARGRLQFVNRRWSEYTGLSLEQTRQQGWESVVHPEDLPAVSPQARRAAAQRRPLQLEYRLRCAATGEYRWHLARISPGHDDGAGASYRYGSATDIEEQVRTRSKLEQVRADLQRANHELALSLAQLEAIINGMAEGLVLCDAQGQVLSMNPAARRLHGLPLELDVRAHREVLARVMDARGMDGEPLPVEARPLSRALRGESFTGYELRLRRAGDGREWIASYGGGAVFDRGGALLFAMVTLRDVTAQYEIERSLRDAVEARDRFLSIASHELRTPLTTLVMQLQLARRRVRPEQGLAPPPAELARSLDVSNRQVQRLARLVDDLLDVSRSQAGRLEFHRQTVDLGALVEEVAGQFGAAMESAGCRLSLEIEPGVRGEWDAGRLEQVLFNLLSNAIKYAPGAAVRVRVRADARQARLEVSDEGPGIDPRDQPRIFDRFERCTADRNIGGLGLGLFLVRQIVQGHGGQISLESEPGRGTCFRVVLPREGG